MPPWRDGQAAFARAVAAPAADPPAEVEEAFGGDTKRFAVYRNNVASGLIGALAATYPTVAALIGAARFGAAARAFAGDRLPASPVLHEYGGDFVDFLAGHAPLADLGFLPDVARLDWARLGAYHAADAAPAKIGALEAVAPDDLPSLSLMVHPAVAVVRSAWPVVSIFEAHQGEGVAARLAGLDHVPEDALVSRPALEVEVRRLPPGAAAFIAALQEGRPLGAAAEAGAADDPGFDLATALGGLFEAGVVATAEPAERTRP